MGTRAVARDAAGGVGVEDGERMMTRIAALSCLALGLFTGCATYWRNNSPSANWDTDFYECTKANSTTITYGGGTGLIGSLNAAEVGSVRTDYAMRDLCL